MRLIDILSLNPSHFLTERAIINAKEVQKKVNELSTRIENDPARRWFASQLYKYLINVETWGAREVKDIPPDAPTWVVKAAREGSPIYQYKFDRGVMENIELIIQYINEVLEQRVIAYSDDWMKLIRHARDWSNNQLHLRKIDEGTRLVKSYSSGYRWVEITNDEALKWEGGRMNNCLTHSNISSYRDSRLFSLRNERDASKLLFDATYADNRSEDLVLTDIKQNCNQDLTNPKYNDYIIDIFKELNVSVAGSQIEYFQTVFSAVGMSIDEWTGELIQP